MVKKYDEQEAVPDLLGETVPRIAVSCLVLWHKSV